MGINNKDLYRKTSLCQKIALMLLGLFLAVLVLEIGLRIGGFAILSVQECKNLRSIKQEGAYRILCLGESTTQNEYPSYLEEYLNQSNIGIKFSVIDKGLAGTKTIAILSQLEANIDKYKPDAIVVMMGINDVGDHLPYEAFSASKITLAFRSLKVYKLTRLLWLHMVTKFIKTEYRMPDIKEQKYRSRQEHKGIQQEQSSAKNSHQNHDDFLLKAGQVYRSQGRFVEEEQLFKKAIALDPGNDVALEGLGWAYKDQGKYEEAKQSFKKALLLDPGNDAAFEGLGWSYLGQRNLAQAEQSFKKALLLDPDNDSAFEGLGLAYKDLGKYDEAEQSFKNAIALNPDKHSAYRELVWIYMEQGKLAEAEQVSKKAVELNLYEEGFYRILATIYIEMGNKDLSEFYSTKANDLKIKYYNPMTIANYRKLKQIVEERKIKLICAQYPVRSVEPLKKLFGEEADGMVFVDNEKIFKEAIGKEGFRAYFRDIFAEDFGHCTDKGNKLLAKNIADVILKEILDLPIEERTE